MSDKARFVQIARQRMKELRCSQAELAREIGVTEKNVSVWLDPIPLTLPTKDKERVVADMARALAMDEPLRLKFFAAAGLIYQPVSQAESSPAAPPSAAALAPAPPPPASPAGGVSIGQVHIAPGGNAIFGEGATLIIQSAGQHQPSSPPDSGEAPPFTLHPLAGRGRNAVLWNEAEAALRVQISYALHTVRPCTLLNLDFDYPQPGAWEAPGSRQLIVNERSLPYGRNLRLAAPLPLPAGACTVFQAKTWQHGPGAAPPPEGSVWVRLEWAEAGRVGSQTHYALLHLDREGVLHQDTAASSVPSFGEQVRAELLQQHQQCQLNRLRLEREALSYGQFPPLKLQNEIDFHKRKQAELEAQLDQLLSGDSEQQTS